MSTLVLEHPDSVNERDSLNLSMQHELEEIEREIEYISHALSQTPNDDPDRPLLLACLGESHEARFNLRGEREDIDKAIEHTTIALTLTPKDDPDFPSLLTKLGELHNDRFDRLSAVDDSSKSIEYASLALSMTPDGHPELPDRLGNLGSFHGNRFQGLGVLEDLDKAIENISRALALTLQEDPKFPHRLSHLGAVYSIRFERLGDPRDIEKSIEYESQAVALTLNGDPNLPNRVASLAVSHKDRFNRLGQLDDLEKAIEYESRALALTPDGHPHLSRRLANLGVSHSYRFERLGVRDDLEKAIECESRALALIPDDHPDLSSQLANLGASHSNRFELLDELGDLEKAIEYESRALASTPDGHPELSSRFANLGISHSIRFERLGELGDIKKAIEYQSRALKLTPDGHPDLSRRLANLGISHSNQFNSLGELGDLEKAIEYGSRALALTPDGHSDFSSRLANLGMSHSNRFKSLGEPSDLKKAIEYQSRALALTPGGHPDVPNRLYNLGISHANQFERLHKQHDLEKAIECMVDALALTPDGHPTQPQKHFSLAGYRLLRYHNTGDSADLHDSLDSFRMASLSLAGSPRNKFKHASAWAEFASENSALNPIEAYQTAINILPQFIWLGATTDQRYQDLEQVQNLATRAAAVAILASEYTLALEWLENARCVVWNQNLMLRSPLDQLHASHPILATRLLTIANQLYDAGSESRESRVLSSGSLTPEQVVQQHHRLAMEYSNLLSQARTHPGFEHFLEPLRANTLVKAARNGPVIAINCHNDRCDALVILPGRDTIDHIPLPNFNGETAQYIRLEMEKSVRNSRLGERGAIRRPVLEDIYDLKNVLAVLWYDVVKPILDFLGYTINNSSSYLPHITWCPTGALSFLPLHAAGDYNRPRSRVFDYVISSYTPTITALLTSTPSSVSCNTRVLAIGQPKTPGHSPLPGTVKELAYLKSHTLDTVEHTQLVDDQATVAVVLDAMEQHDWVHLACHAHQNVQDPTKSGFFLNDDTLDLASINRRSFKGKGLAYLSACQTATGDERLPDEAVHLASGMLMAGYSSVIATMWSVVDEDAPFVADIVYGQLMKEGKLGNGETGRALHNAVADLRKRVGEEKFDRWVPYIHIGL
ncbi:unnamed protein product [Rhizoctonia solani]|uniref:CHAT domain-containing protein n=1 Tax=Rhizoctonia solani TaxID=456999 RepID=A0A8H3HDY9_9AGAM|nr:unnamed protein product [Rhizoctonia solani]